MPRTYTLRFAAKNLETWQFIKDGKKKVETRAATVKYHNIQKGDTIVLSCAGKKFERQVKKVTHFKSIAAMLKVYKPEWINPGVKTLKETEAIYFKFPGYEEKIKANGLIALELIG